MIGSKRTADCVTFHLLRQFLQHVNFPGARLAALEALHDLFGPLAALAARSALSAGLVLVEAGEPADGADDVGALVHNDHGGRAEPRLAVLQRVEVHELRIAGISG